MSCYSFGTICIFRNDTKTLEFAVDDGNGNAVDISDVQSIKFQVALRAGSAALISKERPGDILIDGTNTKFLVPLESSDTGSLSPGAYYAEAEIVNGDGDVFTVAFGRIRIREDLINGGS